jgi:hypothetical protein
MPVNICRTQLNMMETLPKPFGLVKSISDAAADVQISGSKELKDTTFYTEIGMKYYSDTMGNVYNGNGYYGAECSASQAVTYIDLQEQHKLILSFEAFVGTGVSSSAVLLAGK